MSAPSRLRQRGGRWYFYYRDTRGKQREESCRTDDLAEARRYAARRAGELRARRDDPGGPGGGSGGGSGARCSSGTRARFDVATTLDELARAWWRTREPAVRSSADDERWLRRWVLPHLGVRAVSELDAVAVAAWVGTLVAEGLAPRSVRNAHHVLSMLLEHAVDVGLLPRNVAAARCLPAGTLPVVERGSRADVDAAPATRASSGPTGSAAGSAVGRGAAELLTGPDRVRRAVVELREAAETVRREGGLTAADFLEGRAVQLDLWADAQG